MGDLSLFRVSFPAWLRHAPFGPKTEALTWPVALDPVPRGAAVGGIAGARIAAPVPALAFTRAGLLYCRNQTVNYYIDLAGSFADYLNAFSAKTRSTLQRKVRKLAGMEGGEMRFVAFRGAGEADEFHRLARQVAVKTYQEKLFDGAIPAGPEFVATLRALAEIDAFRGFILLLKGEPAAYLYLPAEDDVLIYGYLGYDPQYSEWSPGTVLLFLALERLFAEGTFRYFDFTYGESQTKRLFGRSSFLRADLTLFQWGPRTTAAVLLHVLMERGSSALGRCLDALGIRSAVRRLIRRAGSAS